MSDFEGNKGVGTASDAKCDLEVENIFTEINAETKSSCPSPVPPEYSPVDGPSNVPRSTFNSPMSGREEENSRNAGSVISTKILLRTKKRRPDPANWKRNISKSKHNRGLSYINSQNILVQPKSVQGRCSCAKKCPEKIGPEQQQEIFESFYAHGNKVQQWDYILQHIDNKQPAKMKKNAIKRKGVTKHYFLTLTRNDSTQERVRVCADFFCKTLAITHQWVATAEAKRSRAEVVISPDRRGKHHRTDKLGTSEMRLSVQEHIVTFPKLHLDANLSVAKIHRLYIEWMKSEKATVQIATLRQYRDIFNSLKYGYRAPKKDQGNTCYSLTQSTSNSQPQTDEGVAVYEEYMANRKTGRELKVPTKSLATIDPEVFLECFDFQSKKTKLNYDSFPHKNLGLVQSNFPVVSKVEVADPIIYNSSPLVSVVCSDVSNMSFDIRNTCRICMTSGKTTELVSIFDDIAMFGFSASKILEKLSTLHIMVPTENDPLPQVICCNCVVELNQAFEFKKKSLKSESAFLDIISKQLDSTPIGVEPTTGPMDPLMWPEFIIKKEQPLDLDVDLHVKDDYSTAKLEETQEASTTFANDFIEAFICHYDGLQFDKKKELRHHMYMVHVSEVKRHRKRCTRKNCGIVCETREELLKHRREHAEQLHRLKNLRKNSKVYTCNECGNAFATKERLENHMERHRYPTKQFKCDSCDRAYWSNKELMRHHQRPHKSCKSIQIEKPFRCEFCPMKFAKHEDLHFHNRKHNNNQQPYKCTFSGCDMAYKSKGGLVAHVLCHTGERPFVCPVCQEGFRYTNALKLHVNKNHKDHSSAEQFTCKICGKSFPLNSHLKFHLRTHVEWKFCKAVQQ